MSHEASNPADITRIDLAAAEWLVKRDRGLTAEEQDAFLQWMAADPRHGEDDPSVIATYEDLADAFEAYDGALYDAYGEMTPLDIFTDDEDEEEDDLDDHDDEDGDDARLYSGLDDDIEYEEAGTDEG